MESILIPALACLTLSLPIAHGQGSLTPHGPPGPTMKTLDEIERPSGKHDIFINDRLPSTQCVEKQFLISLFGIVPPGRPKTFRSKERSVL